MGQQRMMEIEVAIPANTTNDNVLAGQQYQQLPFDAIVGFLATGSAAGLRHTLSVGGALILDRGVVNANNRVPIEPDDTVLSAGEGNQGQLMFLAVTNTTAGPLTYRARVVLQEAFYQ